MHGHRLEPQQHAGELERWRNQYGLDYGWRVVYGTGSQPYQHNQRRHDHRDFTSAIHLDGDAKSDAYPADGNFERNLSG